MLRLLIFCGVLFVSVVGSANCATTQAHRTKPTHEPSEHELFTFVYEPRTHMFVISVGADCFIFTLTDDERLSVHTDVGIKALELKLAGLIDTGNRTAVTRENVNKNVLHACSRKATNFFMMSN